MCKCLDGLLTTENFECIDCEFPNCDQCDENKCAECTPNSYDTTTHSKIEFIMHPNERGCI